MGLRLFLFQKMCYSIKKKLLTALQTETCFLSLFFSPQSLWRKTLASQVASLEDSCLVLHLRFCQMKRVCISDVTNNYRESKLKTIHCLVVYKWQQAGHFTLASNYVFDHKLHILLSTLILYLLGMSTVDMDVGFLGLEYMALLKYSHCLG